MQLRTTPPSGSLDEDDDHLDLHVLVLQPGSVIEEDDVVIEEVDTSNANRANRNSPDPNQKFPRCRARKLRFPFALSNY